MLIRGEDLRCKDVINLKDGVKIGTVDDFELDSCTAQIQAIVIGGRKKFFGLLGQEEDIVICCNRGRRDTSLSRTMQLLPSKTKPGTIFP